MDKPLGHSPLDVEDVRVRVQKSLDAFLAQQRPRLEDIGPEMAEVADSLTTLLDGGKRLRAAFCYWGWRGAGGPDVDAVIDAATALELLQACALIHDDVMDGSDTRRGRPAAHRAFATLHRSEGWRGSPETFGTGAAILLGDLCLSWADELLMSADLPLESLHRGKQVYDLMRTELMAGQYLDLVEQASGGRDAASAARVIRYKTSKYTVERPLHLGGSLAGASPEVLDAYTAYGLPLGEAFQLRDDVLGVFGDPQRTGKPAGDDLREGKRTVLVAAALERADAAQAAAVQRHLGDPLLDAAGVDLLRTVIEESGALAHVESLIEQRRDEALAALDRAPLDEQARDVLARLAVAATARRA